MKRPVKRLVVVIALTASIVGTLGWIFTPDLAKRNHLTPEIEAKIAGEVYFDTFESLKTQRGFLKDSRLIDAWLPGMTVEECGKPRDTRHFSQSNNCSTARKNAAVSAWIFRGPTEESQCRLEAFCRTARFSKNQGAKCDRWSVGGIYIV